MPALKLERYGGMLPAWGPRLLPDDQAALARDCYLYSGELIGWREPKLLRALNNSAAKFVYRVPTLSQASAGAYLVFVANANEGDKVKIGDEDYTVTATVTKEYEVLLGATATDTAANLFEALTASGVQGVTYGTGTVRNPFVSPYVPQVGAFHSVTNATQAPDANSLFLIPLHPQATVDLSSVKAIPSVSNGGAKFTGVLYADNGKGAPGGLVAVGSEVTGCVAGTPIVSIFADAPILTETSSYWLGFITDSAVQLHRADDGFNAVQAPNTYTAGAPGSAPGIAPAVPTLTTGEPDWQIWGDAKVLSAGDLYNTLSTHDFGSGAVPVIRLYAPTFGAAYNTTAVAEGTGGARLKFIGTLDLSDITTRFAGGLNQTADTTITGPATWLEFEDPFTDVVRSPVLDDTFQRYYFASASQPPQYNTYDRIKNGDPAWLLGVPAPGCAPGITATGGGNSATIGAAVSTVGTTTTPGAGTLFLLKITPNGAMLLNDIALMPAGTSGTARFTAVLYTDNNGAPHQLLNEGTEIIGCTVGAAVISQFQIPTGLLANVAYWIGCMTDSAVLLQQADGGTTGQIASNTYTTGLPPSYAPAMTVGQPTWNMWGDVTTSAVLESRAYVYTWVTEYGEESPPSPPTIVDAWSNSTWKLDLFTPSPDEMGVTRNIKTTNLYRTITGSTGNTTYFLVASFDVSTVGYSDTIDDSIVALNTQMPSTNWQPPPENLQGIMPMPNGITVGFRGNEIWFSEAYRPHAWPSNYVLTTEFPIVGIGVVGQAVVACTSSYPVVALGVNPASMALNKVNLPEPCLSRHSIVSAHDGVYYYSINGLVRVDQNGLGSNMTEQWVTRERWRELTPAGEIKAMRMASAYFAFGNSSGFTVELAPSDATSFTIWPQPGGHRLGFGQLSLPGGHSVDGAQLDPWTGIGMLLQDGNIYYYDFADQAPTITPYLWRSKKFQQKYKHNFAAFRVFFDVPPGSPTPGARVTDQSALNTLGASQRGIVRIYCDGRMVTARELRYSSELMRIDSGFKGETWQVELEARVRVTNVQLATSVKELGGV